ncbi:Urb2/Npa2 family-domain-containing protein [Hypoxylon sp. NC1633]|nr:Urb2/Npa2 family-domain-containing protein [Hypoxylon sp. NC1633]
MMEVDSESKSRRLALIRAVRTLDEDKTVALPDRIQRLWALLSETRSTRLHGVEENILRWLFKHMSSNTDDAEHVRRYPLTWSILSHIFSKIPPQSLGRSLASLRFVSVLHQTLGDIITARREPVETPAQTNGVGPDKTKKRKRNDECPSDIDQLRTPEGCISSATQVFTALSSLLDQGCHCANSTASERKIGAEHIKSLFSFNKEETRDIAARLILTCDRSLSILDHGISQAQESWIGIVSNLWSLRLHNKDDSLEFTRHMYVPVCSILTRLRGIAGVTPVQVASVTAKGLWIRQLEQFLSAYFIRPARHKFTIDGNVWVLKTALNFSKRNRCGSVIVTWDVAARTPRDSSDPKSKAEHSSWAQSVFETFLEAVQDISDISDRDHTIVQLLDTAIQTKSVPSTAALRALCREHTVMSNQINWSLVAKIVACDADVLLMDDTLTDDVFNRITSHPSQDSTASKIIVTEIILPLEDAFAKARNFSGFILKWYDCLCKSSKALGQTIWLEPEIRQRLARILQSALTSAQLLRVLETLDTPDANAEALLIVVDGLSEGITDDGFIQNTDSRIFDIVVKNKAYDDLSHSESSLRWRIAGRMASWATSDGVERLYAELEPDFKSILERIRSETAASDPETLEALSCCYKLWLASYPGGKYEADLARLTCSFLQILVGSKTGSDLVTFRPYIDFVFRSLPRLTESLKHEAGGLADLIATLFWHVGQRLSVEDDKSLGDSLRSLLQNFDCEEGEALIDALISQPLDALDSVETQPGWTQPQSLSLLWILSEFPREALSKGRRKRIMSSWKKWRSAIATCASQDSQYAVAVLRLLTRVMQQPTFYEGMDFDDLVHISTTAMRDDVVAYIEKLIDLTVRQIATNLEGSSLDYLSDASAFVKSLEPRASNYTLAEIVLVKGLVSVLRHLPSNKLHRSIISLDDVTQALERMVQTELSRFASENNRSATLVKDEHSLLLLSVLLRAATCVAESRGGEDIIELSDETIRYLESMREVSISKGLDIGWKLQVFLYGNYPGRYGAADLVTQLEQASQAVDEELISDLVDAFVKSRDRDERARLLSGLVRSGRLPTGPIGHLLAVRRLIELRQDPASPSNSESQEILDLAAVHERLASQLSQAESLHHFNLLSDILAQLLEKHANSMTQFNIETTLSSVVHICSQKGPKIQNPRAAGEIYERLYKLVVVVLKRHRLRLKGHFPSLLASLRALLSALLTDPNSSTNTSSPQVSPPWVESRLKSRHAGRFARLLTLICEPSAASVARGRSSKLDSATDAAKRAAGQDMFTILELYIKLQLEFTVPRDIRKALEAGVYSILDITPQGCRRVLNESLDTNGRAVFRQIFADYKKFGKWTGV